MKKGAISILILMLSFTAVSCSNEKSKTGDGVNETSSVNSVEISVFQSLLSQYYHLKNALVRSDGVEATKGAEGMLKVLPEIKISSGEHASHIKQLLSDMKEDLEHISATQALGHQRDHFKTLSDNLYELLKINGSISETVYRQYCPMAFDNQGAYWLSSEKEIRNPYWGNKMLKCGSVEETLN